MSPPVIRIHVGVHKTATTYIQDTLSLNRAASAAAGTAYWPREAFRKDVASAILSDRELRKAQGSRFGLLPKRSAKDPAHSLRRFFPEGYNVTISEENLLGGPRDAATGRAYYRAAQNLDVLKRALPQDRPLEVLVALRSYPAFISSLYGEALKHGNHFELEEYKAKHLTSLGLWPRVMNSLREVFPKANIVVWRYEDFARLEEHLLRRLSGLADGELIKPAQADVLPSASSEAIRAFAHGGANMSRVERQLHMLALNHKHPKAGPQSKFSLFDEAETAALCDEYARDIERIKRDDHFEFLG